jgi:hypothetical protein
MDSMAFLPSSRSKSVIDRNQIAFGTIDFQAHPPTLAQVFTILEQEMDPTIRSLNFRVGSLGSLRHSDLIYSGLSASKTAAAKTLETFIVSFSKANSPVSVKPTQSKRNIVDELNKTMENLNLKESSYQSDIRLEQNSDSISNYSEEDFTARYGDASYSSED